MSSEGKLLLSNHDEDEERTVSCKYRQNGCKMKLTMKGMKEHIRICPFGNALIQTGDILSRRSSQQRAMNCHYECIGCDFVGTDTELEKHEHTSRESHLKFMLIFCLKTDLKVLEGHNNFKFVSSDLGHKIQQNIISLRILQEESQTEHVMLRRLMDQIAVVNNTVQEYNNHFHEQIAAMENNLRRKDEQIATLQRQLQEKTDSDLVIRFRLGMLEDFVFEQLTRFVPTAIPVQSIDEIQHGMGGDGGYIMEICKFTEKKEQAMKNRYLAIVSDPFITPSRVVMKLKVFINGEVVEGETCMTVYVVIVSGVEDENLTWPFRGKFTLCIFDPEASSYQFVDSFDADPCHPSFKKPCTERNIGCGFLRSIRHIDLVKLVKDDKVVIKVTVMPV